MLALELSRQAVLVAVLVAVVAEDAGEGLQVAYLDHPSLLRTVLHLSAEESHWAYPSAYHY